MPIGGRYLEINVPEGNYPVRIVVTAECDGVERYVGVPIKDYEKSVAVLVDDPLAAGELLPNQWGPEVMPSRVYVTGPKIIPDTSYSVRIEVVDPVFSGWSMPAVARTWVWGDIVYAWGVANFADITAAVDVFRGVGGLRDKLAADISGCIPDQQANFLDVTNVVDAFKDVSFDFGPSCPTLATCETSINPDNPYYFTGRRLDSYVRDEDGTITGHVAEPLLTLYHYRAREYDARHGRFLQRDPAGYVDGMNLYQYAGSNPTAKADPTGKWEADVHEKLTSTWAQEKPILMRKKAADLVGRKNIETDGDYGRGVAHQFVFGRGRGWSPATGDQSRHLDRNPYGRDTRRQWVDFELPTAIQACSGSSSDPEKAAVHLGRALHSIQDYWAHGDYSKGTTGAWTPHFSKYDVWGYDAVGEQDGVRAHSDGRAPQVFRDRTVTLRYGRVVRVKEEVRWESWVRGSMRQRGTRDDSKRIMEDFIKSIRKNGSLKCRCFFLGKP